MSLKDQFLFDLSETIKEDYSVPRRKVEAEKKPAKTVHREYKLKADDLNVIPCDICPIKGDPVLSKPALKPHPVMVIGAYPGWKEEKDGKVFTGDSGDLLHAILNAVGFDPEEIYETNVLRCRVLDDKGNQRQPTDKEIKACGRFLLREIQEVQPSLIILMGELPLKFFFNRKSVTPVRGQVKVKGDYKFLITFNPAHITREKEDSIDRRAFERDIKSAYDIYKGISRVSNKDYKLVTTYGDLKKSIEYLSGLEVLSVDIESYAPGDWKDKRSLDPYAEGFKIVSVSISGKDDEAFCFLLEHPENKLDINIVKENLKPLLEGQVPKVGQSIKWDYKVFGVHFGWYLGNIVFDTEIASSLLDERKGIHNLDRLTLDWLGERSYKFEAGHIGSYIPKVEDLCLRNCTDADNTLKIYKILKQKLVEADLYDYFMKMRAPAIPTIAKMEMNGLPVNKKYTQDLLDNYTEKIDALMIQINEFPEVKSIPHFNINSNPDLQTLFFDKLKFEHGRKTKTGYSTDKEVLDTLDKKYHHPLISMLQDYKETEKFANTYLDPVIKAHIKYDCRVHPTFTLHIASSGRLSCVDPNVQNVPARDEEKAREIKDCYEAPKGFKIGLGDYSQQELRILAQISQDPVMLEAFRKNEDLHKKTADEVSKVIGVQLSRAVGKGLNFGIVYGETEFGLSASLGVDKSVARSYIDGYLNVYQGVKEYQERQKGYLRQYGYVKTLFGRKRWIKLYGDGNEDDKKNAEAYRKAINTPIQGTGCDITILALILLTDIYEKEEFKSLIISNIHDALMFQMFEEEEDLRDLNVTVMENLPITFMKDVRLKVDWHEAKSWGKAKG